MEFEQLVSRIALALGIGLLMGLERGWRTRKAESGSRAAGIRTFAISGLFGGIVGAMAKIAGGVSSAGGGIVFAGSLAVYAAVITAFSRDENKAAGAFSGTTAIAGILTFAFGGYAVVGDMRIAAAAAVASAGILALREELHGGIARITWPELRSGLVLLAMTFIALPIVPNDPIGPFGGVNPREVWIIAIALACVSFIGYAAVKYFGESRGVLLAATLGGLVSSTAVTIANARRAATGEGSSRLLAAGVAVATAISFLRVFAIAAVVQPKLLLIIGPTLGVTASMAIALGLLSAFRAGREAAGQPEIKFRNPFAFWTVIGFALFLGAIIVLGRVVGESFGAPGAIAGAIVIGLVDVDSVTVSMAGLAPSPLDLEHAAYAILAGVGSNIVSKVAIGAVIGRGWFAVKIGILALFCMAAGSAILAATLAIV
jgi:uncharacterized membrane protein (DUF4010 family)